MVLIVYVFLFAQMIVPQCCCLNCVDGFRIARDD